MENSTIKKSTQSESMFNGLVVGTHESFFDRKEHINYTSFRKEGDTFFSTPNSLSSINNYCKWWQLGAATIFKTKVTIEKGWEVDENTAKIHFTIEDVEGVFLLECSTEDYFKALESRNDYCGEVESSTVLYFKQTHWNYVDEDWEEEGVTLEHIDALQHLTEHEHLIAACEHHILAQIVSKGNQQTIKKIS